jgi:hypothetical protein
VGVGQIQDALSYRAIADENRELLHTLLSRPVLSFEELSLPPSELLRGAALAHYRACAQVFFVSLRHLRGGPQALSLFLAQLPRHLNWQTAFLIAFQPQFPRLLDVEKWWALGAQELRASAGSSPLSPATGLLWIEDLLGFTVEVQETARGPRQRRFVPFQTVLIEWEPVRQNRLLPIRVRQLRQLEPSLPPELRALTAAYAGTLQTFLDQRVRRRQQPSLRGQASFQAATALRAACARLDQLDAQRLEIRARLLPQPERP